MSPLRLDDLDLWRAAFEVRYANAYRIWDEIGGGWAEMVAEFPKLKMKQADPGKTLFRLDQAVEVSVELGKLAVVAATPPTGLQEFTELSEAITRITSKRLSIGEYTRVGLRLIFVKEMSDRKAASEAVISTGMIAAPVGQQFGVSGEGLFPEYSIRKEDGKKGYSVRLKAEELTFELDLPIDWRGVAEPVSRKPLRVSLDVDFYTIGVVTTGQFNVTQWISQAAHVIRRDSDTFLRGAA
jgi:hypothetical protein